jgi:hypothetical protein
VRIAEPARKHGVADDDIRHALSNAVRRVPGADDVVMLIGPARDGSPLEVGVLGPGGDDPVVIHAMPLRPRFYKFLSRGGDRP